MMTAPIDMRKDIKVCIKPVDHVPLQNDGDLSLFFVGTGAAFAKTLNQNNLLIVKGDDHLLIDCGSKCTQALHQVGVSVADLQNFLITHSHADHVGGLEEIQLFGRYVTQTRPRMVINQEYQEILWGQSLRGGSEMSESTPLKFEDLWDVIRPTLVPGLKRETWETDVGGINVKMPRTMHYPDDAPGWQESFWSVGVIIDDRILFTSDTRFDLDLLEEFDEHYNFEMIFHDCQLFTGGVHASLNELKTLPAHFKERIVLMHYGDNWKDFEQEALDAGFHSWAQQGALYNYPVRKRAHG
jgi:L-ascorbate metabolism protein UlaG (beta-lactamase superfamily)